MYSNIWTYGGHPYLKQLYIICIHTHTHLLYDTSYLKISFKFLVSISLYFQHYIFIIWEFHPMQTNHNHFPFLLCPPSHPCAIPEKWKKNTPFPSPFHLLVQKPSTMKSYSSISLLDSLQWLPVYTISFSFLFPFFFFSFFLIGRERLSHKSSMTLILNYESAVIDTIAKEASLPITDSGSTDHRLHMVSGSRLNMVPR